MSKRKMTALQLPVSAQPCWTSQGCSNLHFSTSAVQLVCLSSGKDQKISWCVLNSINSKAMEERMEMGEYREAPCVQQELGRYTGDSLEGRWEEKMRWGRHSRNYPFLLFPDHYYCILNCLADVLHIWYKSWKNTFSWPGFFFSSDILLYWAERIRRRYPQCYSSWNPEDPDKRRQHWERQEQRAVCRKKHRSFWKEKEEETFKLLRMN